MPLNKALEAALLERFVPLIDAETRRHLNTANLDLYFGPVDADVWRVEDDDPNAPLFDFQTSCQHITDWCEDNLPSELYYYVDSDYLSDAEPEWGVEWYNEELDEYSYDEPADMEGWEEREVEPEMYCSVDRRDILQALGYRELASYVL